MDKYEQLRHFADSWGLISLGVFYMIASLFVFFRPNSKKIYDKINQSILKDD